MAAKKKTKKRSAKRTTKRSTVKKRSKKSTSRTKAQPIQKITVGIGDLYLSASIPFFFLTFLYMGFSQIRDPSYINDALIFFVIAMAITAIGINKKSKETHGLPAGRYFFSPKFKKYMTKDMKR